MTPEVERGPAGWRRKEPRKIVMWSSARPTGLIHVAVCPTCKAMILADDYAEHEDFHAA